MQNAFPNEREEVKPLLLQDAYHLDCRSILTIFLPLCVFLMAVVMLPLRHPETPFQRQVVFREVDRVSQGHGRDPKSNQKDTNDSEHYLILAAGMMRSGSTWQYNALRLLMSNLTGVVSGYVSIHSMCVIEVQMDQRCGKCQTT